ncbi:prolyl oligopeptidase family serine peptidase [Paraliobacillus ryukyuensis]|uniref:prolyl oligopeptidase family serine peptidase n=1 Tax=Paraliobacillus ryukyuensis TaxID=200904 RepID=UPI0009A74D25|nr:prolyl oligopeptidase family serine peptidase [Paraliobacillus ryukyuensis]
MIHISKEYWNHIPLLVVEEAEKSNEALPVLTYLHGFTSAKEHNLPIAYLLAERGYRVILPDCYLHGEREEDVGNQERQMKFFEVVQQNLIEIKQIKQLLDKKGLIKDKRFGLAGTSMGGITTAAALTKYDWIKASAVLMGTPKLVTFAEELMEKIKQTGYQLPITEEEINFILTGLRSIDLSLQPEVLAGRPLFFWHGEEDSVVPFEQSYSFHESVVPLYKNPESIRFLREVGRGHKVSRFAILETVNWLEMQL